MDPSTTADLVESLVQLPEAPLAALFAGAGARPPVVLWSPGNAALHQPLLRRFAALARNCANPDDTLNRRDIDLAAFGDLTDWMAQLDYGPAAGELIYRHYGPGIARLKGRDMTGSAIAFEPHIRIFFTAVYEAVARARRPVLTEHQPPPDVFVHQWLRLIYPVSDGRSTAAAPLPVTGFLALIYPENLLAPGLEAMADPVLVTDQELMVLFANHAARRQFDHGRSRSWRLPLFEYTGLDFAPTVSARDLADSGRVLAMRSHRVSGALLSRMAIRVSGLLHNGHAYYMLHALPDAA